MTVQQHNPEMVDLLRSSFVHKQDKAYALAATLQLISAQPGLVGFWPFSSVNPANGNAFDYAGQSRTLTYNGNPQYSLNGLLPYLAFDGTGDYLSRADEAGLDITGAEAFYATALRGLTMGGWFYPTNLSAINTLMSKYSATGEQRSYRLLINTNSTVTAQVSSLGSAASTISQTTTGTVTLNAWNCLYMRYVPGSELSVFINNTEEVNTTSIPASIYVGTSTFQISGYETTTQLFFGRVALPFLAANALPDNNLTALYRMALPLFS